MKEVESTLTKEYEMSDLGEPTRFLGLEINRDRKNKIVRLCQKKFIDTILSKYAMNEAKTLVNTPMVASGQTFSKRGKTMSEEELKNFPYRQIVGSLLYLQGGTRPDITFAVNVLSRKQSNYDENDCAGLQRILRYVKLTRDLGLRFLRERKQYVLLSGCISRAE